MLSCLVKRLEVDVMVVYSIFVLVYTAHSRVGRGYKTTKTLSLSTFSRIRETLAESDEIQRRT